MVRFLALFLGKRTMSCRFRIHHRNLLNSKKLDKLQGVLAEVTNKSGKTGI